MKNKTTSAAAAAQHTEDQARVLDSVFELARGACASAEENEALRLSLDRYGQLVPCLRQGGVVVDGRRRMAALKELDKEPWIVDIDGVSGVESAWEGPSALGRSFLEANGCRRELPLLVRAAIADSLATLHKGTNQHARAGGLSREEAARTVGVSSDTLDRFRFLKQHPAVLERAMKGQMTLGQAARFVRAKDQADHAKSLVASDGDIVDSLERLILAGAQMGVVYVDVPTDYGQTFSTARAAPHTKYPTLSLEELKAVRVRQIAAKDSVLWYWTPNCLIPEALEVIAAWGFTYVTSAVWIKPTGVVSPGAIRPHHETLLVAKRGQGLVPIGECMPSFYQSPALSRQHSAKPTWFADQIDRLYPEVAKVDLFARGTRAGWLSLGNQVPKVEQVAVAGASEAANDDDNAKAKLKPGSRHEIGKPSPKGTKMKVKPAAPAAGPA